MRRLASLTCTTWCFAGLALWLGYGCYLASPFGMPDTLKTLNDRLVLHWLMDNAPSEPVIVTWFICGLAICGVLMLNLLASLWTRLFPQAMRSATPMRIAMVAVHVLFAFSLIGHLIDITVGFKHTHIVLAPGEEQTFDNGYTVKVDSITFADDERLIRFCRSDPRGRMTRAEFHPENNPAHVTVLHNGAPVLTGNVHILSPLTKDGLRVTMCKFVKPLGDDGPIHAQMSLSWNPFHPFFFAVYVLMIAGIILLALDLAKRTTNSLRRKS